MRRYLIVLGLSLPVIMVLNYIVYGLTTLFTGHTDFSSTAYPLISFLLNWKWLGAIFKHYMPELNNNAQE